MTPSAQTSESALYGRPSISSSVAVDASVASSNSAYQGGFAYASVWGTVFAQGGCVFEANQAISSLYGGSYAHGGAIHAASTSDMQTSRPAFSSQRITSAFVTPYLPSSASSGGVGGAAGLTVATVSCGREALLGADCEPGLTRTPSGAAATAASLGSKSSPLTGTAE